MTHPVEYPGNVMPAPGFYQGGSTVDDELLASTVGYTQFGVTLAPNQGILPLGTVIGRVTATKLWVVYDNSASDGREVARGLLRQTVNTDDPTGTLTGMQGNCVVKGIAKNSKVSGADANAITDLNARVDTVFDTFTF